MKQAKMEPYIETSRCVMRFPKQSEVELMLGFAIQNKQHLSAFEPLQPDSYYTENYWKEAIEQIQQDFLADKSCCLNIYSKEDNLLIGMINFNNIIRGCFHSCFCFFSLSSASLSCHERLPPVFARTNRSIHWFVLFPDL